MTRKDWKKGLADRADKWEVYDPYHDDGAEHDWGDDALAWLLVLFMILLGLSWIAMNYVVTHPELWK